MHTSLPNYRDPGSNTDEPTPDFRIWGLACDHFENKRYRDALLNTLEHINPPAFATANSASEPFVLKANHGSASVEMTLEGQRFSIHAPFLKTGDKHRVPLLRKVAEVNFQPLVLSNIGLKDDLLSFEYDTIVDLCHPPKIMNVLREVCVFADRYDDEFIGKYDATFYREPGVTQLDPAETLAVWTYLTDVATEYRRYIDFFETKNAGRLKWELITTTMLQVANVPMIHGTLRWELEDRISGMYNAEIDPATRVDSGKRFLDELCTKINAKAFASEIYHAQSFLTTTQIGSLQQLQQEAVEHREGFNSTINDSLYTAAFVLRHFFTRLLYQYSLSADHRQVINAALEETGGTDAGTAVPILKALFDRLVEGSLSSGKKEKKGFFSKFFG